MPTYYDISTSIFRYFLELSYGSTNFIMHFDSAALCDISSSLQINTDETLRLIIDFYMKNYDKNNAFESPILCFGIIGLQLYCASNMGLTFNQNEFNPVLAKILNTPKHNLQTNIYPKGQDNIWQRTKEYIKNLGFLSNIPLPAKGTGCYVQYPKSQSYLNHYDLNSFNSLFHIKELFKPQLQIDKSDFFLILCRGHLANIRNDVSNRAANLISNQEIKEDILKDQIFRHFLKWEGDTLDEVILNNEVNYPYTLYYDDTNGYYIDNNINKIHLEKDNFKEQLINKKIFSSNKELLILRRDPGYGDFIQVSRAECGDLVRVIVFHDSPFVTACIKSWGPIITRIDIRTQEYLFEIPSNLAIGDCLFNKIVRLKSESPLTWISGIKLDRNTYLKGYGPVFKINYKTLININGILYSKEIDEKLDLSDLPDGTYNIFPSGGRKFSFVISQTDFSNRISINEFGWNLESLSPSTVKNNISGLTYNGLLSNQETLTVRNFIKLSLGKKVNNLPENQLFKALSKR